jgi:hypothetical protein
MKPQPATANRRRSLLTLIFAFFVLVPSLYGFGGKFAEFIALYRGDSEGIFAVSPIINYLLASTGFFCLFGWAALQGMFSDIERPKEAFLEREAMLDEALTKSAGEP